MIPWVVHIDFGSLHGNWAHLSKMIRKINSCGHHSGNISNTKFTYQIWGLYWTFKNFNLSIAYSSLSLNTRLTNPESLASSLKNFLAVRHSSLAKLALPITFGSCWRAPTSAAKPERWCNNIYWGFHWNTMPYYYFLSFFDLMVWSHYQAQLPWLGTRHLWCSIGYLQMQPCLFLRQCKHYE